MWFSEASGNKIGRIDGQGDGVPNPVARQSAARDHRASRWQHLVRRDLDKRLGRIDRAGKITGHPVSTPNASLRGVCVGPDGDLWTTENFANKIARMAPEGTMLGEYDIPMPASGARCISAMSNGRLYFTQWDAGLIGEIMVNSA